MSSKTVNRLFFAAGVIFQCFTFGTTETCDFENGLCEGYKTNCSQQACFKVARVSDLDVGPSVDQRPGTESGSVAYASGEGIARLRRSFEAPFCFSGWYHLTGVKRPRVLFRCTGPFSMTFHLSSEAFVGFWHRVVYPETRTGLVNVSISTSVKAAKGSNFLALDDITFQPGPCPSAPKDGSCDFDWDDACGYSVGNGSNLWRLNHWKRSESVTAWLTNKDVTVGFGGGFATFIAPVGTESNGLLSSPQLKGHTGRQCLRFYYYVSESAKGGDEAVPHGLQVLVTENGGSQRIIWGLSDDALFHDQWSPAQASFDGSSTFRLDFECYVGAGSHGGFYCGLDYVRLTECARSLDISNQDCDFEGGFCSWMNLGGSYDGYGLWTRGGGATKTTLPKPSKDHTLGTSTGSYLFYSSFGEIKGATAQLVSEAILSKGRATNCLEFRYIVAGDRDTKLRRNVGFTTLGKSHVLANDVKDAKNHQLLWEAEAGEFDTWLLGRVALSDKSRVIFEAVTGSGSPPGYIALDDLRVFTNDSCETFPKTDPETTAVDHLLDCDFQDQSLCKWSFEPRDSSVVWRFGSRSLPQTNIGPTPLPAETPGTFIFTNRAMIFKNRGSLYLTSPMVPRQTQPVCATLRYHFFGGLGAYIRVSLLTDRGDGIPGSAKTTSFIYHMDRVSVDRWFTVRRTLDMKSKFNQIKVQIGSNEERPSEMAFGPMEFTSGACQVVTDTLGWCDFEYDTCGWTLSDPSSGWRRQSNGEKFVHSHTRSGPPDSNYFLELQRGRATNDSTVTSPWFRGRSEPYCLRFWYRRDNLSLGKIVVELDSAGGGQPVVMWEQPPYPKNDWMLALVPIAHLEEFKVVFRVTVGAGKGYPLSSFGIDDVQLDPEPCRPLFECDFEEDFCGYVNDFTRRGVQWLVGTGRVAVPKLSPKIPPPHNPSAEASGDESKSWTRFAYVDLTVPTGRPSGWTPPAGAEKADLVSPVFQVGDKGGILRLTYFRSGPDIVSMELRQVDYKDESGVPSALQTVQLPAAEAWQTTQLKLKPSQQSQIIIALTRGKGTNGTAAVGVISAGEPADVIAEEASLSCDFENGTFCGWDASLGDIHFKLNEPAKKNPPFPKSDHTLRAYEVGRFIYAEHLGAKYATARLKSPEIPTDVRNEFCVSLWHAALPKTKGFISLNDTVWSNPLLRDHSSTIHHWAHDLVQMKLPENVDRFTIDAHMISGLIALDDLVLTPGQCPMPNKCTFEIFSPCRFNTEFISPRLWYIGRSRVLNIPDHTMQDSTGHFLYVNTTVVDPAHPEARVFLEHRGPSPATCVTFWWKGIGKPSDLNVYVHRKETVLRDPVLSVFTRPTPHWWNPRSVTVSSKTKWQLAFEAVSFPYFSGQSGVMVDDVEFTDGECPPENYCTFEEDVCIPWVDAKLNSSTANLGWEVERAGSFERLSNDHTLGTEDGHYLLFRATGNVIDSAVLELRERRFQCASFWYYISESSSGCRIEVGGDVLRNATQGWKHYTSDLSLSWVLQYGLAFEAVSFPYFSGQSGVMVDDVEFTDGECPPENYCTFEEDVCIPWVDAKLNSSTANLGWEVERAGSFERLSNDHTLGTEDGHYLLFRATGNVIDSAVLELRERRFQCASFWYYISESSSGCRIEVGGDVLRNATQGWKHYTSDLSLSWVLQYGVTIRAYSGTDDTAFVAIDDIRVDERQCTEHDTVITDDFVCSVTTEETVPMNKVCNFVKDCSNGVDEADCGSCDFRSTPCGWDLGRLGDKGLPSWQRRQVGEIPGSPKLNHDDTTNGFYMIFAGEEESKHVVERAIASAPIIRNTDYLCLFTFWYNYANTSTHVDLGLETKGYKMIVWTLRAVAPPPSQRIWHLGSVVLGRYPGEVRLHFSGLQHPANVGYFAIDEIKYADCGLPPPDLLSCEEDFKCANGACIFHHEVCNYVDNCGDGSDEHNCAPDLLSCEEDFKCANGACIFHHEVCNYVDNCGDGSDEHNCGDYNLGCNFDSSFCDWKLIVPKESAFDTPVWTRIRPGRTLAYSPTRDHTTGLQEGRFLIFRSSETAVQSEIAGPILQANDTCAITFFYTIYNGASSRLILGVRHTIGGPLTEIWSTGKRYTSFDFLEHFEYLLEERPFQVFFKGEHRATDEASYIAIDDVSFTSGCRPYHGTLPIAPPTPAPTDPPTCPQGQFVCVTSRQCIPQSQVCDFKQHCPDGSDERDCGACDFSTDLCGLRTDNPDAKYTWNRISAKDVSKKPAGNYGLPKTDSTNDPDGFYCAFRHTNRDAPEGGPNALLTPPLGLVAHPCTVSFYAFLKHANVSLWFGVQKTTTSGLVYRKRFALLRGSESNGTWIKMSVKVGNWYPGVRFYFLSDQKHASIDGIEYRDCHPDTRSDTYEEELHVSCSFERDDECGWFPENEATELDWVKYAGGILSRRWLPPYLDVGHSGPYMYITNHGTEEGRGHLVSKRLGASGPAGRCFSFWYSMRHPNSGRLSLLARSEDNSTELLWTRSGPQGRAWLRGYADAHSDSYSHFVLEAVLPGSTPAVIAVDHIDVRGGECKSKMVCDFEYNLCGWTLHDWEINGGNTIPKPSTDHTTETGSGKYARLAKSYGRLVSPEVRVPPSAGRCVKFWYYLSGGDGEQLNVSRVTDFQREEPIWSVLASQVPSMTWLSGSVNLLGHQGPLAVAFTGTTSGDHDTAVAVDDIQIHQESCPPAGSCQFEEDFCNWGNSASHSGAMQWYRNSGATMTPGGPSVDHTRNTQEGIYLLLDSQDLSVLQNGYLDSELLSYGPDACFRMFYQMAQGSDAKINIWVKDLSKVLVHKQTISAPEKSGWTLFQQDMKNLPAIYRTGEAGAAAAAPARQLCAV
ncbi:MAM and LDL-receptor class A domain-containing protein 1 [Ixodes scapularis]